MPKFRCSIDGIEHFQEVEIEAETADDAEDKYAEMVEGGEVLAVNYTYDNPISELIIEGGGNK